MIGVEQLSSSFRLLYSSRFGLLTLTFSLPNLFWFIQWKDEIETKTNDVFTVHIHHGRSKLKTVEAIEAKDVGRTLLLSGKSHSQFFCVNLQVVITTYQTLNLDFSVPDDTESGEEAAFLAEHGSVY
jgi:hypothetical protein